MTGNGPEDFERIMRERQKDPSKRAAMLPEDYANRGVGIIALCLGVVLFLTDTFAPLREAMDGFTEIEYKPGYIFLQPILIIYGLIYSVFGEDASKVLGRTFKPSRYGVGLLVGAVLLAIAYFWYIGSLYREYGYCLNGRVEKAVRCKDRDVINRQ